jgi:hypothetical protein
VLAVRGERVRIEAGEVLRQACVARKAKARGQPGLTNGRCRGPVDPGRRALPVENTSRFSDRACLRLAPKIAQLRPCLVGRQDPSGAHRPARAAGALVLSSDVRCAPLVPRPSDGALLAGVSPHAAFREFAVRPGSLRRSGALAEDGPARGDRPGSAWVAASAQRDELRQVRVRRRRVYVVETPLVERAGRGLGCGGAPCAHRRSKAH